MVLTDLYQSGMRKKKYATPSVRNRNALDLFQSAAQRVSTEPGMEHDQAD